MKTENLVALETFCSVHNIDTSFIFALRQSGLAELILVEEKYFVDKSHIGHIEKMIRLHFELEINLEGLEAIGHLLNKMNSLSEENLYLKNRLSRFEAE
jgi:hypothetical protein